MSALLDPSAYRTYLSRLDARALLDHYGARNCTEQANKDGLTTEIIHSCLLDRVEPHHSNGDENPSASVNVEKRTYCCYSGGWSGDLFHLVMKLEGKDTLADTLSTVGQFLRGATQEAPSMLRELEKLFQGTSAYAVNLPHYDESVIGSWRATGHPYWESRGITSEAVALLKLGYDPRDRRVVFPHFVGDSLVGWQKRAVPGETVPDVPKYRSSPGFPKAETLYGQHLVRPGGPVLVVESPFSVAKAYSLGLPNTVATFGAKVTQGQLDLLRAYDRVVVWFDDDPAGRYGERAVLQGLYRHAQVSAVAPRRGLDLGDCTSLPEATQMVDAADPAALVLARADAARRLAVR